MLEVEERVLDEYQLAQRLNQKSPKYFNKSKFDQGKFV